MHEHRHAPAADQSREVLSAALSLDEALPEQRLAITAAEVNRRHPGADETIARLTAWPSVLGMLRNVMDPRFLDFRPTCSRAADEMPVADIFDDAMDALGDPRRAWRW